MKQILFLLGVFALCSLPLSVQADEAKIVEIAPTENQQLVEVENAGALFLFQKQPVYEKQLQIIKVKKTTLIKSLPPKYFF